MIEQTEVKTRISIFTVFKHDCKNNLALSDGEKSF